MSKLDIVIAGVGGQGTILASRVLAQTALNVGLAARTSETIGMAQREGTVQSHVRIGAAECGPVIGTGQADILLGFEPAEAERAAKLLKPSGFMVVNTFPVKPVTVALGGSKYPLEEIMQHLQTASFKTVFIDAFRLAEAAGNFRTVNTVLLGALASTGQLPFGPELLLQTLLEIVPERARAVNERAFALGNHALANT